MLSVLRLHLPSDIPIVGCELTPYVLLRRPDNSVTNDDVPESAPLDGFFVRYKWYRIQNDKRVAICSVHPSEQATLQCLGCVKAKIPVATSYHCTTKCFSDAWQHHRALHERAASAVNENGTEEDDMYGRMSSGGSVNSAGGLTGSVAFTAQGSALNNGSSVAYPAPVAEKSGGEAWSEVGRSRTYTPTTDDIGHVLKFECAVVDSDTCAPVGPVSTLSTSRVIPAPSPTPRRLIPVNEVDIVGQFDLDGRSSSSGAFTVLSYNILSDAYATSETYSYCPSWALSWPYRRQNLLREMVGYHADILCLQEVQSDHFEDFFAPELEKHGYVAVYKRKTSEVFNANRHSIDGCATFFRRDRFSLVKKYEVEFNKAAQSLTEGMAPNAQKKAALNRLHKDNVALIVVLEAKFSIHALDAPGKRQLLCVTNTPSLYGHVAFVAVVSAGRPQGSNVLRNGALTELTRREAVAYPPMLPPLVSNKTTAPKANTHLNVHQDLMDVKLWQVHTLLKGLEKIAVSADIPMLVCGDFNSIPGSSPHALLAMGKVDSLHPDLSVDPLGILRPPSKLTHQLPLVSAYSSFARMMGAGTNLENQRRRMDSTTNEPLFTNYTKDFTGTLDYIFYTADSLAVESLLELLDEESLKKNTALPSPEWSSDHIGLLAGFRCVPRPRHLGNGPNF